MGSYLVGTKDLVVAKKSMSLMNLFVDYEQVDTDEYLASQPKYIHPDILMNIDITGLQNILQYDFNNKAFLVEAITHGSKQDSQAKYSYERLEFLGDAVLTFLISRYLFKEHPGVTEGVLTDFRQAAVNNEYFAYVAAKHNLHVHLRYDSNEIGSHITEFVQAVKKHEDEKRDQSSFRGHKAPKVLGDLVESLAGAIYVDSNYNVEIVWAKMKHMLSPPKTPKLNPLREIKELCDSKHYDLEDEVIEQGNLQVAILKVKLEDCTIEGKGHNSTKKSAKEDAAYEVLMEMKNRGIYHSRCLNFNSNEAPNIEIGETSDQTLEEITSPGGITATFMRELKVSDSPDIARKKPDVTYFPDINERMESTIAAKEALDKSDAETVLEKGVARSHLNKFCQGQKWNKPDYETRETTGLAHKPRFICKLVLETADGELSVEGELNGDKNSAKDSAASLMLDELKKRGFSP